MKENDKEAGIQQINKEQALAIYASKVWEKWSDEEIVKFQLFQDCLAIPFDRFHAAIEKVLKRPVYTHEFAFVEGLRKEFLGEKNSPTFTEIMNLIPKEKRIILLVKNDVQRL